MFYLVGFTPYHREALTLNSIPKYVLFVPIFDNVDVLGTFENFVAQTLLIARIMC